MSAEQSFELLNKRFERLISQRSLTVSVVSEEHRRRIAEKFANKSLQELHDLADQLDSDAAVIRK